MTVTANLPDIDISRIMTEKDNTPNEYFEDLWHQATVAIQCLQDQVDDLQAQIDSHHP